METRNKFKTIANQIVTKEKFKGYIINNIEQSRAVDKIMMFASKYKVFLTNDLDAYHRGEIDKKQLTISIIFKLFYLITGLRFLMSAVINTKTITIVMSDSNYLLGNARLFSILYTNTEFIFLSINTIMLVFEYKNRLYLLTFLRNYKENLLMPMSATNSRKLVTITKIMTKYSMTQAFWPLIILSNIMINGSVIMAYLDPNSGFHWYSVLAGTVSFFIFLINLYATITVGIVAWTLPSFYLKYKFNEIAQQVQLSLHLKNTTILMSAIREHHSISVLTEELNHFFKYMIFIVYYFATPALMILAYLTHAHNTVLFARFIAIFVFILVFTIVFTMALLSSMISQSAEKPRKYLYKCFAQRIFKDSLNKQNRLKIMGFIEKLGGPDIGFYCWDIFPMNYYHFYKYVAGFAITYILLLGFV